MFPSTNELTLTYGLLLLIDESESAFSTTAVKGVHYTSIAITVIFAFCSLFGVIGSITVNILKGEKYINLILYIATP